MVNDLACFIIGDFLKVVVIISVDYSQPVNMLSATAGVIWHRQVLDVWLLLAGAFRLQAEPISNGEHLRYQNVVSAHCAATRTAGISHLGRA